MNDDVMEMLNIMMNKIDELSKKQDELSENQRAMQVYLENDVCKRIDSLFDGYKNVHEKQWELEHKVETLEKRLERLENIQRVS